MDFNFTRSEEMIRDMVKEFMEREVVPRISEMEEKKELPRDIIEKLGSQGLIGLYMPKEVYGQGMSHMAKTLVTEEISKYYPPLAFFFEAVDGPIYLLGNYGSSEQKEKYLKPICEGKLITCFAVTEPGGGSDPASMQTEAKLEDGTYVINGRKVFITMGGAADVIFVLAKTEAGYDIFLVEKETEGFSVGRRENIIGLSPLPVSELVFSNCKVPEGNLIGPKGKGLPTSLNIFTIMGRPAVATIALGISEAAFKAALDFAKERKLRGNPIFNLQSIQFDLVDMSTKIEAARWLCYYVAWLIDQGKSGREIGKEAARAKLFATETAKEICMKAISIMGGYGTTKEYNAVRLLADAIELIPAVGTSEIMKLTIARGL